MQLMVQMSQSLSTFHQEGMWIQAFLGYSSLCFFLGGCGGMGWGLSLFRMSPANSDYANHNSFLTFVYSVQGNTLSTYAHVLSLIPYSHPQA